MDLSTPILFLMYYHRPQFGIPYNSLKVIVVIFIYGLKFLMVRMDAAVPYDYLPGK